MARAAVISAVLENPAENQNDFNQIVSDHNHMIWGRMGIPVDEGRTALISLTVVGTLDEIDGLTGLLDALPNASVKAVVAGREFTADSLHRGD